MPAPEISVVTCTRGRPELLRRLLASLAAQTLERSRFEVIVIHNADEVEPMDADADVVLLEPQPGVSRARNRGWRRATGQVVAFIDDDAEAAPEWLQNALDLYRTSSEPPVAFGGPIEPLWDAPRPGWFKDEYERRHWGHEERRLEHGESLSGSNVFMRREMLERLGGFDARLGPVGHRFGLSEETDLFARMWATEPSPVVVYSPRLVVRHSVPAHKMTVRYRLWRESTWGETYVFRQHLPPKQRLRTIPTNARTLVRELVRAVRHLRRPLSQWAVEELREPAKRWGMIRGAVRRG